MDYLDYYQSPAIGLQRIISHPGQCESVEPSPNAALKSVKV